MLASGNHMLGKAEVGDMTGNMRTKTGLIGTVVYR
jgi:hypothetical protein